MSLQRNIRRIDHFAILVAEESFEACVNRMTAVLQARFERARRDDLGILIAVDWEAGLEIPAPTGAPSPLWRRAGPAAPPQANGTISIGRAPLRQHDPQSLFAGIVAIFYSYVGVLAAAAGE